MVAALADQTVVERVYNVAQMGVVCDAVQSNGLWTGTDNQAALQRVIDQVGAAGGGRLWFPGMALVGRSGANSWCLTANNLSNLSFEADRGIGGIVQAAGLPNASVALLRLSECALISFRGMSFNGNWGNAVTYVRTSSANAVLPQATIDVGSTAKFPASGSFTLVTKSGVSVITYTGKTATSFTGCAGGTGTIEFGDKIGFVNAKTGINQTTQVDPKNYGLMIRGSTQIYIDDCNFENTYGDCIWMGGSPNDSTPSTNIHVNNCLMSVSARSGIAFAGNVEGATVKDCEMESIFASAIDTEPQGGQVKNIILEGNYLDSWFDPGLSGTGNIPLSIVGGSSNSPSQQTQAQNFRVSKCRVNNGGILIQQAVDTIIDDCRIIVDYASSNAQTVAPICVVGQSDAIKLVDNYIYDRVPGNAGGNHDGSITVHTGVQSLLGRNQPTGILIEGNTIEARNGIDAIHVAGVGGGSVGGVYTPSVTGVATGVTDTTMTDAGAAWVADQWIGWMVRIGPNTAAISSNTDTVLTLAGTWGVYLNKAWAFPLGSKAPTPSAGAYEIFKPTGLTEIASNEIDCSDDGYGLGGRGIVFSNQVASTSAAGMRFSVHDNKMRNCDEDGIFIEFLSTTRWEQILLYNNTGWDDQTVPTFLTLLRFSGTPRYDQMVMYNNQPDPSVVTAMAGLTTGFWITSGGPVPMFAGFGSPNGVVTASIGAMYSRLDGTTASVLYVKESGTNTNTGWVAYTSAISSPPPVVWRASPVGGTTTLQNFGPTLTITGTPTNPGYSAGVYYTSFPHIHVASAAGAGSQCGYRANGFQNFLIGTTAGGGFRIVMRFGVADAVLVATANMFVGLAGVLTTLGDVAPSTLTNIIGVGCDSGDTTLQLYGAGAAAQARQNLGASFPVNTLNTDLYELTLFCAPSATSVQWQVRRMNTGDIASGDLTGANLPAGGTPLTHHYQRSNGGAAAAVTIDFFSFYSELEA